MKCRVGQGVGDYRNGWTNARASGSFFILTSFFFFSILFFFPLPLSLSVFCVLLSDLVSDLVV